MLWDGYKYYNSHSCLKLLKRLGHPYLSTFLVPPSTFPLESHHLIQFISTPSFILRSNSCCVFLEFSMLAFFQMLQKLKSSRIKLFPLLVQFSMTNSLDGINFLRDKNIMISPPALSPSIYRSVE